jgi:hypothetical protein
MTRTSIAITALLEAWLLGPLALAGGEEPKSGDKIRVLVVTGGHDYDVAGFERLWASDAGLDPRLETHPKALETITSPAAKDFDAIVLYDMYQPISEEQKTLYARLVQSGKGIVALHHSLASFQAWPEYERIIGGKFFFTKHAEDGVEAPPSGFHHGLEIPVEIAAPGHFVTRGL